MIRTSASQGHPTPTPSCGLMVGCADFLVIWACDQDRDITATVVNGTKEQEVIKGGEGFCELGREPSVASPINAPVLGGCFSLGGTPISVFLRHPCIFPFGSSSFFLALPYLS